MKHISLLALVLALAGCSQTTPDRAAEAKPAVVAQSTAIPEMAGLRLATAVSNGNVTVYPVTSTKPSDKALDDMVTLDEAKRNGWVEIVEREDETVDELEVINKGPKAIFLLAGELLLGGKQDRIVSEDTIIKPGETAKVKVFCVDQGRWSGGEEFAPASMQAPSEVRKAAVLDKDQGMVWGGVASSNGLMRGRDSSLEAVEGDSLKKTVDSKVVKARQADAKTVADAISKQKDVVGVVVVVNGKVHGFEYFGSNKFFGKALPSILNGAFTDALIAKKVAGKAATDKEVAAFVADCLKGGATRTERTAAGLQEYQTGAISVGTNMKARKGDGVSKEIARGSYFTK